MYLTRYANLPLLIKRTVGPRDDINGPADGASSGDDPEPGGFLHEDHP